MLRIYQISDLVRIGLWNTTLQLLALFYTGAVLIPSLVLDTVFHGFRRFLKGLTGIVPYNWL